MSRILLADDSPHAQRMGERILREEGYEVVSLTDGDTALLRLPDVDPDLLLLDAFLPGKSGFELCRHVKSEPRHRHARVIVTAGALETFNDADARNAGADAVLRKPFEASAVLAAVKPLLAEARAVRERLGQPVPAPTPRTKPHTDAQDSPLPEAPPPPTAGPITPVPVTAVRVRAISRPAKPAAAPDAPAPVPAPSATPDPEKVRAAVTIALDAALPELIDEITKRVLVALGP